MTSKQKAAREKFKKVVAEAGKLRKKNPKLTQAQAVKQAWAISYSKAGKTKKVGAVKKDSSASFYKQQKEFEKQKKVNDAVNKKFANWEYPVPPVYTGNWTIKNWSDYITKNGTKIGAIKKTAPKKKSAPKKTATKVKAKKRKTTEQHTDTKSHNVNIRVVSGVISKDINRSILLYEKLKQDVKNATSDYKKKKDVVSKFYAKQNLDKLKHELRERKFVLTNLNKELKKIK